MGKQRATYKTLAEAIVAEVQRNKGKSIQTAPRTVTKGGRAIAHGRITTRSLNVKRANSQRPLPFDLQCHPPAMVRTPAHPDCGTFEEQYGMAVSLSRHRDFRNDIRLPRASAHRYKLRGEGKTWGSHWDIKFALAWRMAAHDNGMQDAVVIDSTPAAK